MSSGTGLDAVLGHAAESDYGVFAAPSAALLFTEESFALDIPRVEAAGIGAGQRVQRTDQWTTGARTAAGELTIETPTVGMLGLLEYALGSRTPVADGAGWKHTIISGDITGKSRTFQIDKPSTDGGMEPYAYVGSVCTEWGFSQDVEGFLMLTLGFDCRDEETGHADLAISPPSTFELFSWKTLAVTVDGNPFAPTSMEVGGNNNLKTDRFFLAGSDLKSEPLRNEKFQLTGSLTGEFNSGADYARFVDADPGDPDSMVPIVFTWTAVSTYDTLKPYKLVVTFSACRFDGTTPNVGGPEVIEQELPFVGLDNSSDEPVTIEVYTSEAA